MQGAHGSPPQTQVLQARSGTPCRQLQPGTWQSQRTPARVGDVNVGHWFSIAELELTGRVSSSMPLAFFNCTRNCRVTDAWLRVAPSSYVNNRFCTQ